MAKSGLRYYGLKLAVENKDGVTKLTQFKRALGDVDGATKHLKNEMKQYGDVTVDVIENKATMEATARRVASQFAREERRVARLAKTMRDNAAATRLAGRDLAMFNAERQLGVDASKEQRNQVRAAAAAEYRANEQIREQNELTAAANARSTRLESLRSAAKIKSIKADKLKADSIARETARVERLTKTIQDNATATRLAGRDLAMFNAERQLGANATLQQHNQVRAAAAAEYRANEALKEQKRSAAMVTARATRLESLRAAAKAKSIREDKLKAESLARETLKTKQSIAAIKDKIHMLSLSSEEQAVLNAKRRLGTNATKAEIIQVERLARAYHNQAMAARASGVATGKAAGPFRNMRGILQNLSWQLQDVVVQTQMGVNSFVVLSQQGSQAAAAFGWIGAAIGAGIAVIGAVMPPLLASINGAAYETLKLKDAQSNLNDVFDIGSDNVARLTKKYSDLYDVDRSLAKLNAAKAVLDLKLSLAETRTELSETTDEFKNLGTISAAEVKAWRYRHMTMVEASKVAATMNANSAERLEELAEKYGITAAQIETFNKKLKDGNGELQDAADYMESVVSSQSDLNTNLLQFAIKLANAAKAQTDLNNVIKEYKKLLDGTKPKTKDDADSADKSLKRLIKRYEKQAETYGLNARQQALLNIELLKSKGANASLIAQAVNVTNAYYDRKKSVDDLTESLKAEDKLVKAKIANIKKLADLRTGKAAPDPLAADLKGPAVFKDPMREFYRIREAALAQHLAVMEKLKQDYTLTDKQRTEALKNENAAFAIANAENYINTANTYVSTAQMAQTAINQIVDTIANGKSQVEEQTKNMTDFQKFMFFQQQSIAAAMAIINGLKLGSDLAATMGWAAPAGISFGAAIGGAQAGAIMATTFQGMFDDGGYIKPGHTGIVSEYGNELVNGVLVKGPANVTSRKDTSRIMNNIGGVGLTVNIVNKAPGVKHEVQKIDEHTVRVIAHQVFNDNIDGGVSTVLNNHNSKSTKTMRNAYGVNRRV